MLTQQTSEIARNKFLGEGKPKKHHEIICRALELCPYPLTAYGISQRCELDKYQVSRRTKEMCEMNLIREVGTKTDIDNARRVTYTVV